MAGSIVKGILFVSGATTLATAFFLFPATIGGQPQEKSDTAEKNQLSRDLHQIGENVAKAVLGKDIRTLLSYSRADLGAEDEAELKNTKSELYCYLFDSSCMARSESKWRSVYDKLSHSHQLGIKVDLFQSSADHQTSGSLTFYDRSSVSEKNLSSPDFLCKEYPGRIASWSFKLDDGKWKSGGSLFDYGTEYCDE